MRKIPKVPHCLLPPLLVLIFGMPAAADSNAAAIGKQETYLIDLPTALRLADAQNPQIQFARERIRAAEAELQRANVRWLPHLSVGGGWTRHDGQIQDTRGEVISVSRSAAAVGGGPSLKLDVSEALFAPLAARQVLAARQAGERAATNNTLLEVALAYYELTRAQANAAISEESYDHARQLDELTQSYLRADKLKPADAERVRVEFQVRAQLREQAEEQVQTASIRLARLLRLDPFVRLQPADRRVAPVVMVDEKTPGRELAALALGNRPELTASRALTGAAAERLREAKYAPLIPNVILDYRAGGFGGGRNGFFGDFDGRSEFEAGVVWEFQNLGLGDRALRRQRASELRQTQIQETAEADRILAEVAEGLARIRSRRAQIHAAEQALEAAGRSYDQNRNLFRTGGIDLIRPIEVLQSIQAFAKARQDYLNAITDYTTAQLHLYWALGQPVNTRPTEQRK